MAKRIIFKYQVKSVRFELNSVERYEVRELTYECDPNKSDRENLDDAFVKACDLGADPNKQVRWRFIEE